MSPLTVSLALAAAIASAAPLVCQQEGPFSLKAELNVFSSSKDPTFWLSFEESRELCETMSACSFPAASPQRVLGYTGFRISSQSASQRLYACPAAEFALLEALAKLQKSTEGIPPAVFEHVLEEIVALSNPASANLTLPFPSIRPTSSSDCEDTPIVGPDTPPKYDPASDNGGCFVNEQRHNNCYNYGNDVVTNTFAQPGRGSGKKWTANTCEEIQACAERDGLIWLRASPVPTGPPASGGHYVALLIWPNTNFHWIRMDEDNMWSHKPGQTPVRNVDNNGQKIADPSKSDFSPWTQFCGYFQTHPANVTLA